MTTPTATHRNDLVELTARTDAVLKHFAPDLWDVQTPDIRIVLDEIEARLDAHGISIRYSDAWAPRWLTTDAPTSAVWLGTHTDVVRAAQALYAADWPIHTHGPGSTRRALRSIGSCLGRAATGHTVRANLCAARQLAGLLLRRDEVIGIPVVALPATVTQLRLLPVDWLSPQGGR